MKTLDNKLIIYDSNCKVCSSLRDVVLRFTTIPETKVKAYKDLNPELSAKVDPALFKNVMALIDSKGENTIYGAEGVAYIFSSQYKIAAFVLSFKPFFQLFSFLYKTQAYNRYIIATPKSNYHCDCFPDKVVKYRLSYIAITMFVASILIAMFGGSLKDFVGLSSSSAAGQMLLMVGTAYVIQIIMAGLFMKDKVLEYIGHLGSIIVVGCLILIPWMVFEAVTNSSLVYLPIVSVLISSYYMLYLHLLRARYLEISQGWTISWFVLLYSSVCFWRYVFYLKH